MEKPTEPVGRLRLPADCTITSIHDIYALVKEAFRQHGGLEIDASDVIKADVTSLQLLLSATKTAEIERCSIKLTDVSDALQDTFSRAGLAKDAIPGEHRFQQD